MLGAIDVREQPAEEPRRKEIARFSIQANWVEAPLDEELSVAERGTFARVQVCVDEAVLTRINGQERPYVVGPTSGLAEWLVDSWVSLLWETHAPFPKSSGGGGGRARTPHLRDALRLWEPLAVDRAAMGRWQQRHTFGAASSDLALPSIVFLPEEGAVGVFVAPMPAELEPEIGISASLDEPGWVRVEDMRDALGRFVDETMARAKEAGAERWVNWLAPLWREAKRLEQDPNERRRATLGAYAAEHWTEARGRLNADVEALHGMLLDTAPVNDQSTWNRRLGEIASVRTSKRRDANIAWPHAAGVSGLPPYTQGQKLAVALREALSNPAAPIDLRDAMDELGVGFARVDATEFRSAAIRTSDGTPRVLLGRETAGLARERFSIAAAIGRLLSEAGPIGSALGAAHGSASRVRATQRANAFAAELLLPAAALREGRDVRELCDDFGISFSAAEWQVKNRAHARPD